MPNTGSSEWIGFSVDAESQRRENKVEADRPFRIAVLGNFQGGAESRIPLARRRPALVDRDNFDDVLAAIQPSLAIPLGEEDVRADLRFKELDDFHPDRLYERLPVFRALRTMRKRLADPATFAEAAGELLGKPADDPKALAPPPADLLEQMLGGGPAASRPARKGDNFQDFLSRIVAPHLVPGEDPRQPELLRQLDAAAARHMRTILHHPSFQALESLWRAVYLLTRRLETGSDLQVSLVHVTKEELVGDLLEEEDRDLPSTGLYKLLVEGSVGTPGAQPWAVLAGDYTFGPETDDLVLLGRLSGIAEAAGAPWISAADSRLAGCPGFSKNPDVDDWTRQPHAGWQALREIAGMQFVGLAAPRFLLRLPYGKDSDPCELFAFEEAEAPAGHEGYLWGNPAIACVLLIGQAFEMHGWDLRPGAVLDLDHLPQHVYKRDGEAYSQPCAEILLTERAAGRMLERGIMPLASIRGTDRGRLVRFQSIADPLRPLAGPWQRRAERQA